MAKRLEIGLKPQLNDPAASGLIHKARAYLGLAIDQARVLRVLTFDTKLDQDQLERVRSAIFTNPVTELSSFEPLAAQVLPGFHWALWVGYKPGVRDNEGATAIEAMADALGRGFGEDEAVYSSRLYLLRAPKLSLEGARAICRELLANDLIQNWRVIPAAEWDPRVGVGVVIPRVKLAHTPTVKSLPIGSDEELMALSAARDLFLNPADVPVIRAYFNDPAVRAAREAIGLGDPTDVELEYISQARSDHCNHNTFGGRFFYQDLVSGEKKVVANLFKECIKEPTERLAAAKDWVVSVLWDNAGVAKLDGEHNYVITGETHNSPSNMEAYGGALTGIVGIYRDPMGTGKGSKLILGMYAYCVGPRDYNGELSPHLHPRRLLDGVIEGVRDGGNKSGVPTPYGLLLFDESYLGKCLVFVTAMGIMPAQIGGESSHKKVTSPGDLIVMSGGRVGKDGIHGVTAASETYSEHTPAGHVQIGDPYTQKKMHDFLLEARDEGLISFITDCGGGGLSSAVGESARFSNGCRVDLDKVPLKCEGLDQWEIWVSESQERMIIAVKPEHLDRFMALSRKHAVESTVIGEYNDSGYLRLDYKGKTCAYVRMDFLESEFPQWEFDAEWSPPRLRGLAEPVITEPEDHGALLKDMLARPNICARNWIARQYDHEVQGGSVIKPLVGKQRDVPSDAAVIRPILEKNRGIAVSQALNPFFSIIDTYDMVAATIDEAVRKVISVGGDPQHLGGVDNFCWPSVEYDPVENPDGKYKAAQLVRANWALRDYCMAYGIPLLSGKDSMYIDGKVRGPFGERRKVSGLPTLLFTVCSVIDDVSKCVTMDVKFPEDLVYVVGKTSDELGASEFYQRMGHIGLNVPKVDAKELFPVYVKLARAIDDGLVASCHAIGRGGLAVHLALIAWQVS